MTVKYSFERCNFEGMRMSMVHNSLSPKLQVLLNFSFVGNPGAGHI